MKKILVILACIMLFATITACNEAPEAPPVEVPTAEAPQPVEPVPAEPEQEQGQEQEPIEEPEPELEEPEINENAEPLLPAYLEMFAIRDSFEVLSFVLNEDYEGDIAELPEMGVAEIISLVTELLEWSEEAATGNTISMAGDMAVMRVTVEGVSQNRVFFDNRVFIEYESFPEYSGVLWEVEPSEVARLEMALENYGWHPDSVYELRSSISFEYDGMVIQVEEYLVISARTEPYAARFLFIDGGLVGWVQRTTTIRLHEFRQGADMAIIERFMGMPISDYYVDTSDWGQVTFY